MIRRPIWLNYVDYAKYYSMLRPQMEEKRKDLTATKQRELLNAIVTKLNESNPSFYYSSTSEIAYEIEQYIQRGEGLNREQVDVLGGLSRTDIQMVLSLHSD